MATICKIEKTIREPATYGAATQYPKILVWAILDDEGHTIYETSGIRDDDFRACREWLVVNPQPLVACLNCQE